MMALSGSAHRQRGRSDLQIDVKRLQASPGALARAPERMFGLHLE